MAAGTVSKTNMQPVWTVFNGVNLGFTGEGDVTVTVTPQYSDYMAHQTGNYLLESYFNGARATAQVTIAESNEPDNWVVAFSQGEKQDDTTTPTAEERFALTKIADATNSTYVARRATSIAQKLELIPVASYVDATTETATNVVLAKAWVRDVGDILYSLDNGVELACTFEALFDPTAAEGENLAWIGKTTETWTAS